MIDLNQVKLCEELVVVEPIDNYAEIGEVLTVAGKPMAGYVTMMNADLQRCHFPISANSTRFERIKSRK